MDRFIASPASNEHYAHAEGPVRDAGRALWVDIVNGDVHEGTVVRSSLCPVSGGEPAGCRIQDVRRLCHVDGSVGAVLLAGPSDSMGIRPGLVLAAGTRFIFVDQDGSQRPGPSLPGVDGEAVRFNDAKVDPWGRILAGTMAFDAVPSAGALYRLDPDGTVTTLLPHVSISNGMGWSADGTVMYYIDSATGGIDAFDYDVAGVPRNRRRFVDVPPAAGAPDGMCVDEDDHIWVAIWGGSELRRYSPTGELVAVVEVDAPHVSSCTFVGEHLELLLITTSRQSLSEDELRANPNSGALFLVDVGVSGQPQAHFDVRWHTSPTRPRTA